MVKMIKDGITREFRDSEVDKMKERGFVAVKVVVKKPRKSESESK